MSFIQTNQVASLPANGGQIPSSYSGKIIMIPALPAARTINLPPAKDSVGTSFTFQTSVETIANVLTISANGAERIFGTLYNFGTALTVQDKAAVLIAAAGASKGIRLNLFCDGISWYCSGNSPVVNVFTAP